MTYMIFNDRWDNKADVKNCLFQSQRKIEAQRTRKYETNKKIEGYVAQQGHEAFSHSYKKMISKSRHITSISMLYFDFR